MAINGQGNKELRPLRTDITDQPKCYQRVERVWNRRWRRKIINIYYNVGTDTAAANELVSWPS